MKNSIIFRLVIEAFMFLMRKMQSADNIPSPQHRPTALSNRKRALPTELNDKNAQPPPRNPRANSVERPDEEDDHQGIISEILIMEKEDTNLKNIKSNVDEAVSFFVDSSESSSEKNNIPEGI